MRQETVLDGITEGNAIDLGLSVKWASCNVGSKSPEEFGNLFSWGEVEPKSNYEIKDCKFYKNGNEGMLNAHGPSCDAARTRMGNEWRTPTRDEVDELLKNCSWQWGAYKGVNGVKLTSHRNGNSIFLPACGIHTEESYRSKGAVGYYWTSNICPSEDYDASCMIISRVSQNIAYEHRYRGIAVRAVNDTDWNENKMFQPSVKVKTSQQYTWGLKKSGPALQILFVLISIFIFFAIYFSIFAVFRLLLGAFPCLILASFVGALMTSLRGYFFNKKDAPKD